MWYETFYKIKWHWWMLKTKTLYRHCFGAIGSRSTICRPMYIAHPENMYLGNHVRVREFARLETIIEYDDQKFSPTLTIGNDVGFEQGLHMTCSDSITIGNSVVVLAYVMITDSTHATGDFTKSVLDQELTTSPVVIEDGCFIGLGARIFPGTHLGKHCSVGSNAVVTGGIYPDYCVLVGAPAKCIKRYDMKNKVWRKTDEKGRFIDAQ